MRDKIYNVLNKIYGVTILVSLFAGLLPIIPFIIAIIIGGEAGANISVFLYKQYYPWVAVLAAVSVLIGLVALYINKTITFKFPKKEKKAEASQGKANDTVNTESNENSEQAIDESITEVTENKEDQPTEN